MNGDNSTAREITLDAVKTGQMQLRDSLGDANALVDSIKAHLAGDSDLKSPGEQAIEARPTPSGMLAQMCELGVDNQQALNRLVGVLQNISGLTGAS